MGRIIDITQEVFGSRVWPGDPEPVRTTVAAIADGSVCNVTAFSMCVYISLPTMFFLRASVKPVFTSPGISEHTSMPNGASSLRMASASELMADFEAE